MSPRLLPRISLSSHTILRPLRLQRRTLIAAPSPNDGPLLTRRSDRALPEIPSSRKLWLRTLPIFLSIITLSTLAIFNYQKASSSIVNATLYALRTSEVGKRELGEQVYFRDKFPWIWGEMNQLHGRIDISFGVKGTKGRGVMRFKSVRKTRMGFFETHEWSLEMEDGRKLQLLDETRDDPFKHTALQAQS
ncbi:MAG: hypothetical protein Q9180_001420 [Flavoplaca navasiana]